MDYDDFLNLAYDMGIAASPGSRDAVVKYAQAVYNAGIQAERIRCIKICEDAAVRLEDESPNKYFDIIAQGCADEIRKAK